MHAPEINNLTNWDTLETYFTALLIEELTPQAIPSWLDRWSDLEKVIWEWRAKLKRDRSRDETNETTNEAYRKFINEVFSPYQAKSQELKTKFLNFKDYIPAHQHVQMLRYLRAEENLFRQENVQLQADINASSNTYGQNIWNMTIKLEDKIIPLPQAEGSVSGQDQAIRKQVWQLVWGRWKEKRNVFDQLFIDLVHKRQQLAHNAGFANYRAYRWQEQGRFDYSPTDCLKLHSAIETEIIPLSKARREIRRRLLRIKSIHPWDQECIPDDGMILYPFANAKEFEQKLIQVYHRIDPEFGALFERMQGGYLDLGVRQGKPHGGEEWIFPVTALPYVRAYTVGTYEDVNLVLHESGHAFHDVLSLAEQKIFWNMGGPTEFSEFVAITMTYLARPYLEEKHGGFYTSKVASRVYHKELEDVVIKWLPSIAQVDAFQHWVYTTAPENITPANLDEKWLELSHRFDSGVDWTGLAEERALGWQRVGAIFSAPFYQIEYALAHLGALQVWQKAQQDFTAVWKAYKEALLLGDTRSVPELYRAAGAELSFEREQIKEIARFLASSFAANDLSS